MLRICLSKKEPKKTPTNDVQPICRGGLMWLHCYCGEGRRNLDALTRRLDVDCLNRPLDFSYQVPCCAALIFEMTIECTTSFRRSNGLMSSFKIPCSEFLCSIVFCSALFHRGALIWLCAGLNGWH
jgi:hypothetical protein